MKEYDIVDLAAPSPDQRQQAALILVEAFREMAPEAWPTMEAALEELEECLGPERIARAAIDEQARVVGWIGGIPGYHGRVWELHPLAVLPAMQNRGIGRQLAACLEREVVRRGGLALWLGTDDVAGMTSLAGIDLYPGVIERLAAIRNLRRHPFEFYRRAGFELAGVVPDANGFGRPDILMAKRVEGGAEGTE